MSVLLARTIAVIIAHVRTQKARTIVYVIPVLVTRSATKPTAKVRSKSCYFLYNEYNSVAFFIGQIYFCCFQE